MAKGEVRYRLVLDTKDFQNGIKAAKNEANAMANDLSSKLGKAGNVLSAMGPAGLAAAAGLGALAGAAGAAVKATIDAVSSAAKYADAMAALQDKTGLSSEALQKLEVAAKLGNSSIDAVASAVNKMQDNLVKGSKDFERLGLSIQQLKAMTPEQQFQKVSEAILSLGTAAERTAASKAILGKAGTDLIGVMKASASGATELGGALNEHALAASADLADKMDLLDVAAERVKNQFGAAIAQSPELQKALTGITEILVVLAKTVQNAAPDIAKFFDNMISGAKRMAPVFDALTATGMIGGIPGLLGNLAGKGVAGSSAFQDALMFSDVQSGGSSTGNAPPKGRGLGGGGKGLSQDRINELMRKVMQDQAKQREAFQEEQLRGALSLADKLRDVEKKTSDEYVKGLNERDKAYDEMSKAMVEKAQADEERMREVRFRANQEWVNGLRDVASAMTGLGQVAGGTFGTMVGLGGAAVQVFANLKDKALQAASNTQKVAGALSTAMSIMSGPGGAKGALSGAAQGAAAGAAFGGIGAVIGGVAGGILGLFGGPSKAEKKAEDDKKIKDTISQLDTLMQKAKALKMDMLTKGVSGLAAMFGHLATMTDVSGSRLERLGRFGADMLAKLRAEGLSTVEAFKVMGPALDKALEAIQKNGGTISGAFGNLLDFRSKVQQNESLVGAVEGFNDLMSTMSINKDSIRDIQDEMGALFDEMTGKGFTSDQALSLIAPTLLRIRDAAREGRIAIDEQTQAMITEAEQKGLFEGMEDPMKELVEVQKMMLELWAAIAQMQGVTLPESLRKYIAEIHNAQNAVGNIPVPGGGANIPARPGGAHSDFPTGEGEVGNAASGLHTILGRGPLSGGGTPLVAHPGEEVYIGRPRGPRGGMGGGMGPIVLTVDGKVWAEHNISNLRKNRYGSASQSRRHLGR